MSVVPSPRGSGRDLLSADLIAERSFPIVRRGFDRRDVEAFLKQVAEAVRTAYARLEEVDEARRAAEERAKHPEISEEVLMARVGEETADILRSARAAAGDMQRRAADEATRVVDEAHQRAGEIRGEAEAAMAKSVEDANRSAEEIRANAQKSADQLVERARREVESLRQMAEQERKLTVEGAQSVREKILADLTRRRRVATVQIEQLRAGRERLLESYGLVRRTLQEVHDDLQRADAEARAAADQTGRDLENAELPELPPDLLGPLTSSATAATAAPVAEVPVLPEPPAGEDPTPPPVIEPVAETADAQPAEALPAEGLSGDALAQWAGEAPTPEASEVVAEPEAEVAAEPEPEAPVEPAAEETVEKAEAAGEPESEPEAPKPERASRSRRRRSTTKPTPTRPDPVKAAETPVEAATEAAAAAEEAAAPTKVDEAPEPPSAPDADAPNGNGVETPAVARIKAMPARTKAAKEATAAAELAASATKVDDGPPPSDLFARIRAGREEAVTQARQVLADPEAEPEAAAEPADVTPAEATAASETEETGSGVERTPADEALLEKRDGVVGELETILTRKLKRALQDEQNTLLDRLRSTKGEPDAATLLGPVAAQRERYMDAGLPQLELAAREGSRFAVEVVTEAGSTAAVKRAPKVDDLAGELADLLSGHIRRRVEQAVESGGGDEQTVLVEAIGAAYREIKTQQVERAAGDHAVAAFSRGIWEAVGDRINVRWVVEDLDGPCADCDDNALAGALSRHEGFPTGQPHPPAHSGCRCLLVPEPPTEG